MSEHSTQEHTVDSIATLIDLELERVRFVTAQGVALWLTAGTEGLAWREVKQWQTVRCRVAGEPPRLLWTARPEYATLEAWSEAVRQGVRVRALNQVSTPK